MIWNLFQLHKHGADTTDFVSIETMKRPDGQELHATDSSYIYIRLCL